MRMVYAHWFCSASSLWGRSFDRLRTGIARKKKLLEKQKAGKRGCGTRRDRQHGVLTPRGAASVGIPQEAFIAALRMGKE
jgi:translation elongation factor EF-4